MGGGSGAAGEDSGAGNERARREATGSTMGIGAAVLGRAVDNARMPAFGVQPRLPSFSFDSNYDGDAKRAIRQPSTVSSGLLSWQEDESPLAGNRMAPQRVKQLLLETEHDDESDFSELDEDFSHASSRRGAQSFLQRAKSLPVGACQRGADNEPEMIDIDLIKRRSKRHHKKLDKPSIQKGWEYFRKSLFFPLYVPWWTKVWKERLSGEVTDAWINVRMLAYVLTYMCQVAALALFFSLRPEESSDLLQFEAYFPLILLLMVAAMQGHCAAVSRYIKQTLKDEREASSLRGSRDLDTMSLSSSQSSMSAKASNCMGDKLHENGVLSKPSEFETEAHYAKSANGDTVPSDLNGAAQGEEAKLVQGRECADTGSEPGATSLQKRRNQLHSSPGRQTGTNNSAKSLNDEFNESSSDSEEEDETDTDSEAELEKHQPERRGKQAGEAGTKIAMGAHRLRPQSMPPTLEARQEMLDPLLQTNLEALKVGEMMWKPLSPVGAMYSSVKGVFWSQDGVREADVSVQQVRDAIYVKINAAKPDINFWCANVFASLLGFTAVLYRAFLYLGPFFCWLSQRPELSTISGSTFGLLFSSEDICYMFASPAAAARGGGGGLDGSNNETAVGGTEDQLIIPDPFVCPWAPDATSAAWHQAAGSTCNERPWFELVLQWVIGLFTVHWKHTFITVTSLVSSNGLAWLFFHIIAMAEDAFRRRLLYAKYFSKITSTRRARKANIPHFRLNKVNHIRVWLDLRSDPRELHNPNYRFGDAAANVLVLTNIPVVVFVCLRMFGGAWSVRKIEDIVTLAAAVFMSFFMYRLTELATQTKKKYDSSKILYTEQLNLYIKIFSSPDDKEELVACNNMLKICLKLIKELEANKGKEKSGKALMLNPIVYNLLRVTILSALGTMSSSVLGFKIRLWKI